MNSIPWGLERTVDPVIEPVTLAEVRSHVNLGESTGEPVPEAPTAALASPAVAGNVDNGVHRYRVTFVTASGETDGGTISSAVTVADKTVNGKITLSAIPLGGSAVTSRKLYRTAAGGSTYLLLATIADNTTTTYTDNVADTSLGAGCPATNTTQDPQLTALIASARRRIEERLSKALLTQTWVLRLDRFPAWEIGLPRPPLASISSIQYLDSAGATQTLDAAKYVVDTHGAVGRVVPAYGLSWPSTYPMPNAVTITYVAGWTSAAAVPADIRQALLMLIADLYANRETIITGTITNTLSLREDLLASHRSQWEPEFA